MGYKRHHTIAVTSWSQERLIAARENAVDLFGEIAAITGITPKGMNSYSSFFIAPDGSKEGWEESDRGDMARGLFVKYLESTRDEDGGNYLDWVIVQYGDDERETLVCHHSDEDPPETEDG